MVKDLLYSIVEQEDTNEQWRCRIALNPQHIIFQAHFPEKPVLPGACIVEICKELLSNKLQKDLILKEAKNIKFLHLIEPQYNHVLDFIFHTKEEENLLICTVSVQYNELIFSKLRLTITKKL
jgi:3-hydroxyacyl-[acyl-carrier-protein] dehydratase